MMIALILTLVASATAIIETPTNTTYGSHVPLSLVSTNATNLTYTLGNTTGGCTNCTSYTETLVLPDGHYTLAAAAGNESENVSFTTLTLHAYGLYANDTLFASSNKKANLSYRVDTGNETSLCTNCSVANTSLPLPRGNHTIVIMASSANETANQTLDVTIGPAAPASLELTVTAPSANTTYLRKVPIDIAANRNATLSYRIDDSNATVLCSNCTSGNASVEMSTGTHAIELNATSGNESTTKLVNVTVTDFSITVVSPTARAYNGSPASVLVNVTGSERLDSIEAVISSWNASCSNCTDLVQRVNLSAGEHTLSAVGTLDGLDSRVSVVFSVTNTSPENETRGNETKTNESEPRFTVGLNKLPQAVESGEYTDPQLASIIRNNSLNPGVLNRLIKTGKLGNESINAILDTQFAPEGIWHKLFGWLGIGRPSVPEEVANTYNVTAQQAQQIAVRHDTPPGLAKKVVEQARERTRSITSGSRATSNGSPEQATQNGNPKREGSNGSAHGSESVRTIGSQTVPPGQTKKRDRSNTEQRTGGGRVPPGQARKSGTSESGTGASGRTPPGLARKD